MSLFKTSTRENPLVAPKTKAEKKQTFLYFPQCEPGEKEMNQLVYKIRKKENKTENLIYVGNPFTIGLSRIITNGIEKTVDGGKAILLQGSDNELYLVITEEGKVTRASKTWASFEMRTHLHYVPKLNNFLSPDEENELLFDLEDAYSRFIATGVGIEGMEFEGYKLTFRQKLIDNQPVVKQQEIDFTAKTTPDFTTTNLDELQ